MEPQTNLTLTKMGQVLKLAFANIRITVEILLVAAIIIGGWMYNKQQQKLLDIQASNGILADNLQEQITIKNGEIEVLKRKKDGKVEREYVYMPPEGWYRIQYYVGSSTPTITIKTKGFCLRPGFGAIYGSYGLSGELDLKLAYLSRYSAGIHGNTHMLGAFVSRHLDDLIWGHPKNVEFFVGYGLIRRTDVAPLSAGIRSNF